MQHIRSQFSKHILRAILPVAAAGLLSVSVAQAAITSTGDVSPTDLSTWATSSTTPKVGITLNGTLTINEGSSFSSKTTYIGYGSGVTGTATVDGPGSTWTINRGFLHLGYYGNGALSVSNGGVVSVASKISLGYITGSVGTATVTGTGSRLSTGGTFYVSYNGTGGAFNILNGGSGLAQDIYVAAGSGTTGRLTVDGSGSTWTSKGILSVGNDSFGGAGYLNISNGGAVTAASASINNLSRLTTDIGSKLTVGGGTGALTNAGTIRMVAGAGAANGTYTPISAGTWSGTGTVQALGGIWDLTNHTVTVADAALSLSGRENTIDLSTTQRMLFVDAATAQVAGASFLGTSTPTNLTLSATTISGSERSSLLGLLGTGESILSGWDFNATEGYAAGDPAYLSLFAGSGYSLYDLTVWHYDGSAWSKFDASDLAYDQTYASFTATGLSGYAVTGTAPVPIPAAAWLLGSGLMGLVGFRRKSSKA